MHFTLCMLRRISVNQDVSINLPGSFFFGRHMVSFRCLLPLYYDLNGIRRFSYLHLPVMSSSDIDTCKCHARTFAVVLLQIPRANFFFFLFWRLPRLPLPSPVNVLNLGKSVIKGRKTGGEERDENTLTAHFCFAAVRAGVGIVTSLTEIINSLFLKTRRHISFLQSVSTANYSLSSPGVE